MEKDVTNPWTRADLEAFNVETLALIQPSLHEEYTRLMKERAHRKSVAATALEISALAVEMVSQSDTECRAFWDLVIPRPDNVVELEEYRRRYE